MMPQDETDMKAEAWFNDMLERMRYGQDYSVCMGHSKELLNEDGSQKGIAIRRPYVRLFTTGVTKMYRMTVLREDLPKTEYTDEQEKELVEAMQKAEEAHEREK